MRERSLPTPAVLPVREVDPRPGRPWAFAVIFLLVLLAYFPALKGGFIWDDDRHVTKPQLQSLDGLRRIWFELGATQQYYPVLHSAFWIEHRLWGEAPLGYHLVNVLLHATGACLFVVVLQRLWGRAGSLSPPRPTGGASGPALPRFAAWLGGLIFALHPVCVESVAWVSEQKNTLSTVFYLLAALAYFRFYERRQGGRRPPGGGNLDVKGAERSAARESAGTYCLATFLFILALLSKSVTATLPAGLLVVIWWKRGRLEWRRDLAPVLPWLLAGLSAGLFTAWVERRYIIGAEGTAFTLSFVERCLLAGRVTWFYLAKLFWPENLIFIYPRWQVSSGEVWQYLFPIGVVAVLALLWRWRRRFRGPLAGFLFFVGSLVPALGFVNVYPFVYSYVADHFQYLASLGIISSVAGGWGWLLARSGPGPLAPVGQAVGLAPGQRPGLQSGGPALRRNLLNLAGVAILCLLGCLTWRQCHTYRDAETLYRTTLARNPGCWMAEINLGKVLRDSGRTREAIPHYEKGIRLKPDAKGYYDLGDALVDSGRFQEAEAQYRAALRLNPNYPEVHINLALALFNTGRLSEAAAEDEEALRLRPSSAEAHNNLGNVFLSKRRNAEAQKEFEEALRLRPSYAKARNGLGAVNFRSGKMEEAAREFEEALKAEPSFAEAHLNLGVALSRMGRVPEAMAECEEALRLRPNFAAARTTLQKLQAWMSAHGGDSKAAR